LRCFFVNLIMMQKYFKAGEILDLTEFGNWISEAEQTPTLSLNEAKSKWESKKKQLLKEDLNMLHETSSEYHAGKMKGYSVEESMENVTRQIKKGNA